MSHLWAGKRSGECSCGWRGAANLISMPRPPRPAPNAGDIDGWPTRRRADPIQETTRRLVINIQAQIGDRSVRSVAAAAGLDHNVLRLVLSGHSWPDVITVAKLERWCGEDLWPGIVD